jgi:hypothetical protein
MSVWKSGLGVSHWNAEAPARTPERRRRAAAGRGQGDEVITSDHDGAVPIPGPAARVDNGGQRLADARRNLDLPEPRFGEVVSDVIAAVLTRDADLTVLPSNTPPAERRRVRRSPISQAGSRPILSDDRSEAAVHRRRRRPRACRLAAKCQRGQTEV